MPRPLPTLTPLPLRRRRDPFDHRDWLFELKLDGFRALAYAEAGQGRLVSRNGNTFKRFAPLASVSGTSESRLCLQPNGVHACPERVIPHVPLPPRGDCPLLDLAPR